MVYRVQPDGSALLLGDVTVSIVRDPQRSEETVSKKLIVIGAGGFAPETIEVVHAINAVDHRWDLIGLLDDRSELHGNEILGLPVIGSVDTATQYDESDFVVSTGTEYDYFSRKHIVQRLGLAPHRYATLVHPAVSLPRSATLGPGCVVFAGVVITASVRIESHVLMLPGVILTHDNVVEDYVILGLGALCGGNVVIREGAYVGPGAIIREERKVGRWSFIGAGAMVEKDVADGVVAVGSPAKPLRKIEVPDDVA
jgi:sugar O-acyltransferase (sialic acid O-acetyltransferase NeuD family)